MKRRVTKQRALAKINLSLHVTGRRADGYHLLDSVVAFAEDAFDTLEVFPDDDLILSVEEGSPFIPTKHNLVVKVAELLQEKSGVRHGALLHLTKRLPIGGGIGGGSADAAAALHLLNDLWELNYPVTKLAELGEKLGADVPVCVYSTAMRMEGVGEILTPLKLPKLYAVLANPGIHVATKSIFAQGIPAGSALPPKPKDNILHWLKLQHNALQPYAVRLASEIDDAVHILAHQEGCAFARMSGSGSTCFGLFRERAAAERAAAEIKILQPDWWVVATALV